MEEIVGLKQSTILPMKVKSSHNKAKNFLFRKSRLYSLHQSARKLVQWKFKFLTISKKLCCKYLKIFSIRKTSFDFRPKEQ